jgi:hypothetical protein
MKKVLAALVVLGLTSFAFASDANKTEKKAEKKAEKVKKAKKEANKTK